MQVKKGMPLKRTETPQIEPIAFKGIKYRLSFVSPQYEEIAHFMRVCGVYTK